MDGSGSAWRGLLGAAANIWASLVSARASGWEGHRGFPRVRIARRVRWPNSGARSCEVVEALAPLTYQYSSLLAKAALFLRVPAAVAGCEGC